MSILTQNERDGLDDVFKSIHSSNNNYKNIKELLAFIISKIKRFKLKKFVKQAKYGTKQTFFSRFLSFIDKKKKKLSK